MKTPLSLISLFLLDLRFLCHFKKFWRVGLMNFVIIEKRTRNKMFVKYWIYKIIKITEYVYKSINNFVKI